MALPNGDPGNLVLATRPVASPADKLLHVSIGLSVTSVATMAIGYVFQGLMGRSLSAGDFAMLSALLAVAGVVERAFTPLELAIAREIAAERERAEARVLAIRVLRASAWIGIAIAVGVIVADAMWPALLGAPLGAVVILAATLVVISVGSVAVGVAHGEQHLVSIAMGGVTGALARLGLAFGAVLMGFGLIGALAGQWLRSIIFGGVAALRASWRPVAQQSTSARIFLLRAIPLAVGSALFALVIGMDVIAANAWLPDREAAQYAAAAVVGKLLLVLPGGVSSVIFPKLAARRHDLEKHSWVLRRAIAATVGGSFLGVLVAGVTAGLVVPLLFGEPFRAAAPLVVFVASGAAFLGIGQVLLTSNLARGGSALLWPFATGAIVEATALYIFHGSPAAVVGCFLAGCLATLVGCAGATMLPGRGSLGGPFAHDSK